jgi:serine/threonine protein kinase
MQKNVTHPLSTWLFAFSISRAILLSSDLVVELLLPRTLKTHSSPLRIEVREMALEELQNGRYHYLRLLGTGGMGEVYLMNDTRVNRQVAIKVIRSESAPYPGSEAAKDAARLFQREARAIAALDHPNILPLYDFGEETHDETTMSYMVMPFCTEGSLMGWLRQSVSATLSPQDIAQLVEQSADALQYAHDHQVIHLDVKPSNFLLRNSTQN